MDLEDRRRGWNSCSGEDRRGDSQSFPFDMNPLSQELCGYDAVLLINCNVFHKLLSFSYHIALLKEKYFYLLIQDKLKNTLSGDQAYRD